MSETKITTVNAERFRDTALFSITLNRWGNRAKVADAGKLAEYLALTAKCKNKNASAPMLEGSTNTKNVNATKRLMICEALDAVNEHLYQTKKRCLDLCMPSRIRDGIFVASLLPVDGKPSPVQQINTILNEAITRLEREFLPEFALAFPVAVERMKRSPIKLKDDNSGDYELDKETGGLGPLFDPWDYPRMRRAEGEPEQDGPGELDIAAVLEKFGLKWNWLALTVPEGLPAELREVESEKLRQQFQDAATEVRDALRVMFAELLQHATDSLKVGEDGKKKVFRDTLTGNLQTFFDTFAAKNIMGDGELASLVQQARAVMLQQGSTTHIITPEALRTDDALRNLTAQRLGEIKTALAPLVAECQTRKFDFSE